jgi:hypothetical protein
LQRLAGSVTDFAAGRAVYCSILSWSPGVLRENCTTLTGFNEKIATGEKHDHYFLDGD